MNHDEFITCLLVLELLRDSVETTDDETAIVREAHSIVQEYRDELQAI